MLASVRNLLSARRMGRHVALKVVKSAPRYTETALDEIKLLQRLITSSTAPTAPTSQNPNPPPSPSHTHPGRSHVISFLDHFRHKGPNGTHVCMVFEVLGENLLGLIKRHQNKGVPMPLVRQIAKQVLLGLDYMHRCCGVIHTGQSTACRKPFHDSCPDRKAFIDLKPENVLICIDNVEDIIQAELASSSETSTRLVGVPPSKGRGGNQTPRSDSVYITGSQPLPSPSSSFGTSPMLDKLSFTMSKIEKDNREKQPDDLANDVSNVSLNGSGKEGSVASSSASGHSVPSGQPGPSLLTQQAPANVRPIPNEAPRPPQPQQQQFADEPPLNERITVKIADLGNGMKSVSPSLN